MKITVMVTDIPDYIEQWLFNKYGDAWEQLDPDILRKEMEVAYYDHETDLEPWKDE